MAVHNKLPEYEGNTENKSGGHSLNLPTLDSANPWHSMRLWYQKQCLLSRKQKEKSFCNFWIEE